MKQFTKFIIFIIFLIFGFIFLICKYGIPGMSSEIPGDKLTETYLQIGDYSIGKQKFQYNICHKDNGCIQGKILGINMNENKHIYIYYEFNYITSISGILDNEEINYLYTIYKDTNQIKIKNINDSKNLFILNNEGLKLYSQNEIKNLDLEEIKIFEELIKKPQIIIDGKKY